MASRIYGRSWDVALVHRQLIRSEHDDGGDDRPVLVFEGAAGSGKTTLLKALDRTCRGTVPRAYLDLESVTTEPDEDPVPVLIAAIAVQLARRCRLYGSLRFDRLVIGLLAVRMTLDPDDLDGARRQIADMLANRRSLATLKQVLSDVATDVLAMVPGMVSAPNTLARLIGLAVDGVAGRMPGRRAKHRRARDWYGHQDQDPQRRSSAVSELMELHWSTQLRGRPDGLRAAHTLLWRALLADLRDNYQFGRRADEWTANCLLLLDNADNDLGHDFLHHVVQPRLDAPDAPPDQAPLTVVVTSRGEVLGRLGHADREGIQHLSTPRNRTRPARLPPGRWAHRPLPGLTAGQLTEMFGRGVPDEVAPNLAQQLVELTGGHPEGVTVLWDAVRADGGHLIEPESLLARHDAGGSLETVLRRRLLRGIPEDQVVPLETCALARTPQEARRLLAGGDDRPVEDIRVPVGMWDPAAEAHTTLLRLLLQRQVARRQANSGWDWTATHKELRTAAGQSLAGELYHLLADEQVDDVVDAMTAQLLARQPGTPWLPLLDAVTVAPHRPGQPRAVTPVDPAQRPDQADDAGPQAFVRTLVTVGWTVRSPTFGSNRSGLYWRMAGGYRRLSRHLDDTSQEVFERIQTYEQLARRWQRGLPGDR